MTYLSHFQFTEAQQATSKACMFITFLKSWCGKVTDVGLVLFPDHWYDTHTWKSLVNTVLNLTIAIASYPGSSPCIPLILDFTKATCVCVQTGCS